MKLIIQRVKQASVTVEENLIAEIQQGFLILVGVGKGDTQTDAELLAKKTAFLRIFEDENEKMNLSIQDVGGSALVVSQFTLFADCSHGRRPSFIGAAPPREANELYEYFATCLQEHCVTDVQTGSFGADMQVELINDGPVTNILDSEELK